MPPTIKIITMSIYTGTFEEVTSEVTKRLETVHHHTTGTVRFYFQYWRRIKRYMDSLGIQIIDLQVCDNFLKYYFGDKEFSALPPKDRNCIRAVMFLKEYLGTGEVKPYRIESVVFYGKTGILMKEYIAEKISLRLAKYTIYEYEQHIYRFFKYLEQRKINDIKDISLVEILIYVKSLDPRFKTKNHTTLRVVRDFFKFICKKGVTDIDLSRLIPGDNYKSQPELPSTYTKEEIAKLLASVDRTSAIGKRNYAILLLAVRLGLRASDIAGLMFDNLLWEQNTIRITQFKTGMELNLPLLPDVGNAIIDYMKYGRPKSVEPHIFLIALPPYHHVSNYGISSIVQTTFSKTDINISSRKHGSHALRHTLAGFLMENSVQLPVISEVLGHASTESTRYYLRIDLKSLRQCVLDVPAVDNMFYSQKGGYFYEQ
jgi:site-specific recombinase XerD